MPRYRFITRHKIGKWYSSLEEAQRYAERIGAGFLDLNCGKFVAYRGTLLEIGDDQPRVRSHSSNS